MGFIKRYSGFAAFLCVVEAILVIQVYPPSFAGWEQVTVSSGQTLWTLGQTYCPDSDPRDVYSAIEARNHIDSNIQPGDVLWVPTKSISAWQRLAI